MNQLPDKHLALDAQYSLSSDEDCSLPQTSFTIEPLRDHSVVQSSGLLSPPGSSIVRFSDRRAATHDSAGFTNGHIVSDNSASGSLSTSPTSSASPLAYSSCPPTSTYGHTVTNSLLSTPLYPTTSNVYSSNCTTILPLSGMNSAKSRYSSITDRSSNVLNPVRTVNYPISPTSVSAVRQTYQTSTPGLYRHYSQPRYTSTPYDKPSSYGYCDTRSTMMSAPSVSQGSAYAATVGMSDGRATDSPPFLPQDNLCSIVANGQTITPHIEAKVEKGFFYSADAAWTCYRRNYFSVQCSYSLMPYPAGAQLFLLKPGEKTSQPIVALGVCLTAVVDGAQGKVIDLVQHTPKRDKGPQSQVKVVKLLPAPPGPKIAHLPGYPHGYPADTFGHHAALPQHQAPYLPLQTQLDSTRSMVYGASPLDQSSNITTLPTAHQHTFERIQFKSATANNGKRRAQQQYYHLIIELHADIRNLGDKEPKWVKVAQRSSQQVVVRGRSPSHYQNEGPNSARTGTGGSASTAALTYGAYTRADGMGYTTGQMAYGAGAIPHHGYSTRTGPVYTMEPHPMSHFGGSMGTAIDVLPDAKPLILSTPEDSPIVIKPAGALDPYAYFGPTKSRVSLPLPPVTIPPPESQMSSQYFDERYKTDAVSQHNYTTFNATSNNIWQGNDYGKTHCLMSSRSSVSSPDAGC